MQRKTKNKSNHNRPEETKKHKTPKAVWKNQEKLKSCFSIFVGLFLCGKPAEIMKFCLLVNKNSNDIASY